MYWESLNTRDRLAWVIGATICLVYLFYLLIYSPLITTVHRKHQALLEKQETLVWMQEVRQQYKPKKARQTLTSSQLLTVLAKQLNDSPFKQFPYQLQQTGADNIQLIFEQVPYTLFLNWLYAFSEQYDVSIQQVNIEKTNTAGVVKSMILLATR